LMGRRGRDQYLCSDAHVSGVIVKLLSTFQTCDVGTGRWAVGFMDRRDWPGDEPVMATKQQVKHFANHMLPCRERIPYMLLPAQWSNDTLCGINTAKG
jgi:hypothetical protein